MAVLIGVAFAVSLVGCSRSASHPDNLPTSGASTGAANPDTLRGAATGLAYADHSNDVAAYVAPLRVVLTRCGVPSPNAAASFVEADFALVTSQHVGSVSRLSVMRVLAAGIGSKGSPTRCHLVVTGVQRELEAPTSTHGFAGYAATTAAFAAAHRADRRSSNGYLPRLANGKDSFVVESIGRVTVLIRNFDPALTQALALASIRNQLLPRRGLHSVYDLDAANCHEQIYLSPTLGKLLSSSASGASIELTSGHGISSHYNSALVNRARITIGGRIGGQPCV